MNCPKCNAELAPDARFCAECGASVVEETPVAPVEAPAEAPVETPVETPVEAPVATEENAATENSNSVGALLLSSIKPVVDKVKPILSKKPVLYGIIGGLALLIVLAIVCGILGSGNGYVQVKQHIWYELTEENVYSVMVDNKVLSDTIESEEGIEEITRSMDGTAAVIRTGEGDLYGVSGKKLKQLAEDVTSYELSVSGDYVVYKTRGEDDETTTLVLCKLSNGKTQEICDDVYGSYAISPDGKSVAYYVEDDESYELMLYKGKKSVKITDAEDSYLYGLSNGGKYIYVSVPDEESEYLYAYNAKGDKEKLETIYGYVQFNADHTQVMFSNKDGKTYISTKGKKAVKASSDEIELVIPSTSYTYFADYSTYPVSNLYGHVYTTSNQVWIIKKNSDKNQKLASKAVGVTLDDSAEYIYYIYDMEEVRVAKVSDGDNASDRAKVLVDEAVPYRVTSDRKNVYYLEDDTLYSVNGKKGGKAKEITDDVESYLYLNSKDVLYYIVDDDLYACTNGKKGTKVASDIDDITEYANGLVVASNGDAVYVTTGSKKPKKILDIE